MIAARVLIVVASLWLPAATAAAQQRATVRPYIDVSQTVDADLKHGDVLTYSSLGTGVDAGIGGGGTEGQLSYRYERRIGEGGGGSDTDVHSGLVRVEARLTPALSLGAGGIATRTRADIRGTAPGVLAGDADNVSQVYALYAGPTLAARVGALSIDAGYQLGYAKADVPSARGVAADQPRLDYFGDSVGQNATASVGVAPRTVLPIGLTASAGWQQERASQLRQHFDDAFLRGDVIVPVSATVALTGGAGYQKLTTSQRSPRLDSTGQPVLDGDGRFVTDDDSPRRITYRTEGLYYDAGVLWHPNRRTALAASVGRRYGSISYTGTLSYQASAGVGVNVQLYDTVTTFGRQLRSGVAGLPTSFIATRDQFAQAFNGCTFGTSGATPGACLNDVFQSVTTASYRARGVDAVVSATQGLSTFGAGLGYVRRTLFAAGGAGLTGLDDLADQSLYADLMYRRQLSRVSGMTVQAFADRFDPALPGAADVVSIGTTASYYHDFGRLGATAALGVYAFKVGDGVEPALRGQALVGARYNF